MAAGDDEVQEAAPLGPVHVDELLDPHLLVAEGMKPLGDAELAREARDGVLVETQGHDLVAQRTQLLRGPGKLRDGGGLHRTHEAAEARAREDPLASGQDREAQVVEGLEIKDTFDPQRGAEEQRRRETTRLVRAPKHLAQRAFGDAAQGERGGQEEEGTPDIASPSRFI